MRSRGFFGTILSIGFPGTGITVGTVVPTVLAQFYQTNYGGAVTRAWIGQYTGSGNYRYEVVFNSATLGQDCYAEGWVNAGGTNVTEFMLLPATGGPIYNNINAGQIVYKKSSLVIGSEGSPYANSDIRFGPVSLGRGRQSGIVNTSTRITVANGTEAEVFNINLVALPGRAYQVSWGSCADTTAIPGIASVHLRDTTSTGAILWDGGQTSLASIGQAYNIAGFGVLANNTAATITQAISLCLLCRNTTSSSIEWLASPTEPRYVAIDDIGAAADYDEAVPL